MKIRPTATHHIRWNTGRKHLTKQGRWTPLCGAFMQPGASVSARPVSKDEMCKHCLKHTEAWEVAEQETDALQYTYNQLFEEYQQLQEQHLALRAEFEASQAALKGYTADQLEFIRRIVPPPETLEGYRLEYRCSCERGEYYWSENGWSIIITSKPFRRPQLIRIPIVEYIEDDEITDDMLQGGRLPCEVRDEPTVQWTQSILLYVRDDADYRFFTPDGDYEHCRIKKSELPEADE